jgi:hypothetical protein
MTFICSGVSANLANPIEAVEQGKLSRGQPAQISRLNPRANKTGYENDASITGMLARPLREQSRHPAPGKGGGEGEA